MHDWTLVSIYVDWAKSFARIDLLSNEGQRQIIVRGLSNLRIPKENPWGPSVSINRCKGPIAMTGTKKRFSIEIQSGDILEIIAEEFDLPSF